MSKELAKRGYDVFYVAQRLKGEKDLPEKIDGVIVRWVSYARSFGWANGWHYYKALLDIDPDIVIQRMTSFITGIIGLYCKKHHKKFVWICSDNAQPVRWVFLKRQKNTFKDFHVVLWKKIILIINAQLCDLVRHYGMRYVTYPFTQNDYQKRELKINFGLESDRIISGHELPKCIVSPEERLRNRLILWVGNLGKNKGPERFIELARIFEKDGMQFVMIGSKKDSLYLRALFKKKPNNLQWLGRLSFKDTLDWFARATLFVNTSWNEGFPNTLIQAWLHGVPVITLGVDPDGVIQKYKLGFVAKNVGAMLKVIDSLLKNVPEYIAFSARVFEYARSHHSIERMADDFLRVLGI